MTTITLTKKIQGPGLKCKRVSGRVNDGVGRRVSDIVGRRVSKRFRELVREFVGELE